MKLKSFVGFLFSVSLLAEGEWKLGGGSESLQSSYLYKTEKSKDYLFIEKKFENSGKLTLENRNRRFLGSGEWKNQYLYLSLGHRYKPLPGFSFLKDPDYYSAFQSPKTGFIDQPLLPSLFAGLHHSKWFGAGVFMAKNFAEKRAGFYFHSPEKEVGLAFSPELNLGYHSIHSQKKIFPGKLHTSLSSEWMGDRKNYFGFSHIKLFSPSLSNEFLLSGYREGTGYFLSRENNAIRSQVDPSALYLRFRTYHHNQLSGMVYKTPESEERFIRARFALFQTKNWGLGPGVGVQELISETQERTGNVQAFLGYLNPRQEFLTLIEFRENSDRMIEGKYAQKFGGGWKLEVSSQWNHSENRLNSFYEQWFLDKNINVMSTDRVMILKIKLSSPYLVLNWSASRKKTGEDFFYMNLQFQYQF
ncbi:MAG: hypothetical protein H7A24_06055 [Leptospiraceae bacterium]|nr:hypothetical protein [Leptospiraceae bacterium]